jgi:hypothetical protein
MIGISRRGRSHPGADAEGERLRAGLVAAAVTAAAAEVARTDSKVSVLLTLATGSLAGLLTFASSRVPPGAEAALLAAAALAAVAVVVLLTIVRPRLCGARRGGILPTHERLLAASPAELCKTQDAELRFLSGLAVAKFRRVRLAVDLLLAAVAALAAAVVIIAV